MYLPTPDEYAKQHGHTPFPPRWERWLSAIRRGILTGRGIAGQNVSVGVHPGEGTVYNVNDDNRGRNPVSGGGAPPILCTTYPNIILTTSGISVGCGCVCFDDPNNGRFGPVTALDLGVNTTYPAFPLNSILGYPNFWSSDVAGAPPMPNTVRLEGFNNTCSEGCVDSLGATDESIGWNVLCDGNTGLWYIDGHVGTFGIFYGVSLTPSWINLVPACGSAYSIAPPLGHGGPAADYLSVANGGSAFLTLP